MYPVSFRAMKRTVSRPQKPMPPELVEDELLICIPLCWLVQTAPQSRLKKPGGAHCAALRKLPHEPWLFTAGGPHGDGKALCIEVVRSYFTVRYDCYFCHHVRFWHPQTFRISLYGSRIRGADHIAEFGVCQAFVFDVLLELHGDNICSICGNASIIKIAQTAKFCVYDTRGNG